MTATVRFEGMSDGIDNGGASGAAQFAARATAGARRLALRMRRRFVQRLAIVAACVALLLALVILQRLEFRFALMTALTVMAVAAMWPTEEDAFPGDGSYTSSGTGFGSGHPPFGGDGQGWRAVIDAIPEPAIALDSSGVVMHHNFLVSDLYPNIRRGKPISHVTRNPELIEAIEANRRTPDAIVVQFFERIPVERRISATVSRLARGDAPTLPSLLITFRDLTEQDKLAQMRADFIANASHELRTPLASLRGFVETLQGPARDDSDARDRFLGIMASQATRMTRLIDDLLSLSRVEMRVHLPPRGIVDLNEASAYVAQTLEPLAAANKVTITLNRLDGAARVRADRDEIVQVLQNLVQNAIKYGRTSGRIEISVAREAAAPNTPRKLTVSVIDDGPGIAPEHLPRLTERFYRVNVTSSRDKGGTGLGLAIVKHILNRHRGDLRITSTLGEGSTFTILLDELGTGRSSS